jgi:hypothetical protein
VTKKTLLFSENVDNLNMQDTPQKKQIEGECEMKDKAKIITQAVLTLLACGAASSFVWADASRAEYGGVAIIVYSAFAVASIAIAYFACLTE